MYLTKKEKDKFSLSLRTLRDLEAEMRSFLAGERELPSDWFIAFEGQLVLIDDIIKPKVPYLRRVEVDSRFTDSAAGLLATIDSSLFVLELELEMLERGPFCIASTYCLSLDIDLRMIDMENRIHLAHEALAGLGKMDLQRVHNAAIISRTLDRISNTLLQDLPNTTQGRGKDIFPQILTVADLIKRGLKGVDVHLGLSCELDLIDPIVDFDNLREGFAQVLFGGEGLGGSLRALVNDWRCGTKSDYEERGYMAVLQAMTFIYTLESDIQEILAHYDEFDKTVVTRRP